MDKFDELIQLYDFYEGLINDANKEYFKQYYFENNTLVEISENLNVSKNAVSKGLMQTEKKLYNYEDILKLKYKNEQRSKLIEKINDEKLKKEFEELE